MGRHREAGVTLVVSLLLLLAVLLLAASSAGLALMGEKAARAERDRHVALQSAEDALMDAERDIETAGGERAVALAVPGEFPAGCGSGATLGLCGRAEPGGLPAWQTVGLDAVGAAVALGAFTGASVETGEGGAGEGRAGAGPLPLRRPQYIVERLPYHRAGEEAGGAPHYHYRVTAIGFGSREETQVVLQSAWRRPGD